MAPELEQSRLGREVMSTGSTVLWQHENLPLAIHYVSYTTNIASCSQKLWIWALSKDRTCVFDAWCIQNLPWDVTISHWLWPIQLVLTSSVFSFRSTGSRAGFVSLVTLLALLAVLFLWVLHLHINGCKCQEPERPALLHWLHDALHQLRSKNGCSSCRRRSLDVGKRVSTVMQK